MRGAARHPANIGLACQHAFTAHDVRENLFVPKPVLQRQHQRVGADQIHGTAHGGIGLERLDQHDHQLGDPNLCSARRRTYLDASRALRIVHPQAFASHGVDAVR